MIMGFMRGVAAAWAHDHPAGHAQMRNQDSTVVKIEQEVLGASTQAIDSSPFKAFDKVQRKGNTQIRAALFDPGQHALFKDRGKAPPYGLDFGQFRHEAVKLAPFEGARYGRPHVNRRRQRSRDALWRSTRQRK